MSKYRSAIAAGVLTAMGLAACHQPTSSQQADAGSAADAEHEEFKTLEDRFSYAYGADLASKFKAEGIDLNVDLMMEAMKTVFEGGEKKMATDEVAATLQVFQEVHMQKKEEQWAIAAEKNKKEGEAFLAQNAKRDGVVITKSGLQYKVIKEGDGGYTPTEDDEITVHYRGTFIDGTEFDSTHERKKPYTATPRQLILGWTEAMQMMSKGAKWEIYVPAELAYGESGSDPYIGPNAVLIFEVELLDIQKAPAAAQS